MPEPVLGLSSMATKSLLAELSDAIHRRNSMMVRFESAGGVEIAERIRAAASADLAVLGMEAMKKLDADGLLQNGTLMPLFVSDVVAAVPVDGPTPALSTEEELKAALLGADRIAYSTGPSGKALVDLLSCWELADVVAQRLVQTRPGVPVASLLVSGEADLGFQQRSELSHHDGIRVLGPLPGAATIRTTFGGAVLARSSKEASALEVLRFFTTKEAETHVLAAGMTIA